MSRVLVCILSFISISTCHLWSAGRIDSVVIAYEPYHTIKRVDYLSPVEMYAHNVDSYINYITVKDSAQMLELATAPLLSRISGDSCIAGSRIAVRTYYSDGTDDVYGIVDTVIWYKGRCGVISLLSLVTVLIHLPKEYLLEICCFERVKR